jgi:hypothetical protein
VALQGDGEEISAGFNKGPQFCWMMLPMAQHGMTVVSLQSRSNSASARSLVALLVGLGKKAPKAT